ncbi:MAG: hypothetical protein AAFR65_04710 [Pseudomonadota bacterium]
MLLQRLSFLMALPVLALSACSGGGGSSGGSPESTAPTPPGLSVFSTITLQESQGLSTGVNTSASDGGELTVSLSGPDAALFSVANGLLTANQNFDFEAPADADGDNVYEITITVTEAGTGLSTSQDVTITIRDETGDGITKLEGTVPGDLWGTSVQWFEGITTDDKEYLGLGLDTVGSKQTVTAGALVRTDRLFADDTNRRVDLNNLSRNDGITFIDSSASAPLVRSFSARSGLVLLTRPEEDLPNDGLVDDLIAFTYSDPDSASGAVNAAIDANAFPVQTGLADFNRPRDNVTYLSTKDSDNADPSAALLGANLVDDLGVEDVVVKTPDGYRFFDGRLALSDTATGFLDQADDPSRSKLLRVSGESQLITIFSVLGNSTADVVLLNEGGPLQIIDVDAIFAEAAAEITVSDLPSSAVREVISPDFTGSVPVSLSAGDLTAESTQDIAFVLDYPGDPTRERSAFVLFGTSFQLDALSPPGNPTGSFDDLGVVEILLGDFSGPVSVDIIWSLTNDPSGELVIGTPGRAYVVEGPAIAAQSGSVSIGDFSNNRYFEIVRDQGTGAAATAYPLGADSFAVPFDGGNATAFAIGVPIDQNDASGTETTADAFGAVYVLPPPITESAFTLTNPIDLDAVDASLAP